ncbi:MAG TPA: DUF3047 domain-containing protein [Gemmatimonadales bacterium]|nr:DUF3047 domain-containing protein [Gemmatimonadales bacterium]
MIAGAVLALQALTTISLAPAGPGLPRGWKLQRTRGAEPPSFAVTRAHRLRIEAADRAGIASFPLRRPLRPQPGRLTWQWRTGTPLPTAVLRQRTRDDAPVRVFVTFEDGWVLSYSWGNKESREERWRSGSRGVIVLQRGDDADGSWHMERRDPFADYRLVFNRAPKAIVAVGVGADTDQLSGRAVAEVSELTWEAGGRP